MSKAGCTDIAWPDVRVPPIRCVTYEYMDKDFMRQYKAKTLDETLEFFIVVPAKALFVSNGMMDAEAMEFVLKQMSNMDDDK